ncbi:hypothetical protein [Marinicrinis lubricantis]|uniref:Uncharacterized protein n=1 Tax=Marinicrinis lubricantis TaxID=2086470 RepID=A0ABW1IK63_9BACL
MNEWLIYGSILLLCVLSAVATIVIGNIQQNKENPDYMKRTKGNILRLSLVYVAAGVLSIVALVIFLVVT